MNVILETERDRRTLAWLIQQVGEPAYPSNLAKCLGLVPPDSLARPSSEEVQAYLNDMRALLRHPTLERRASLPQRSKNP